MRIFVGLDNGLLPDRFGKHAPEAYQLDGHPVRSFPIEIADVPEGARTLALTFLDYDAVPVGGFCWIHWLACDIAPDTTLVPENASASGELAAIGRLWQAAIPTRGSSIVTRARTRLTRRTTTR